VSALTPKESALTNEALVERLIFQIAYPGGSTISCTMLPGERSSGPAAPRR